MLGGFDIPLNQGCLAPVKILIPKGSFLSPSDKAAVVGGNVLTSQRVTDDGVSSLCLLSGLHEQFDLWGRL